MHPTILPGTEGGFTLVFPSMASGTMQSTRMFVARSRGGDSISEPRPLSFGNAVEGAADFVTMGSDAWLYFASGDRSLRNIRIWRARIDGTGFDEPQHLPPVNGLERLSQWPRWVGDGQHVKVTYRGTQIGGVQQGPAWTRLTNGVEPEEPRVLLSEAAAYPRVVPMGGEGCFFSFQRPPENGHMATWYTLSPDCVSWADPLELSPPEPPNRADVHDAYAIARSDGGIDVYYIYPSLKGPASRFKAGADLYRRSISPEGVAGPEQRLTDRDAFYTLAPTAHRLADGSILVSFSDIQEIGPDGLKRSQLMVFRLSEEAPPP